MRKTSLLGAGLVVYLMAVIVASLFSVEWMGARSGPLFLVGLACAFPAFYALHSRSFDPLEPIWLYTAIFFLEFFLKPLLTLLDPHRFGFAMIPMDYFSMPVSRSLLMACFGLTAFYFGYYSVLSRRRLPVPVFSDDWRRPRMAILFLCGLGAFAYSVNYFLSRAGYSIRYIYLNRALVGGFSGELSFLVHVFSWITAAIAYRYCLMRGGLLNWTGFLILVAALVAGLSIFGARWTMLFIPMSMMLIRHYAVARYSGARLTAAFSIVFAFSASFGAYRGSFSAEQFAPSRIVSNLADEIVAFADWDIFLAVTEYYPDQRPFYAGRLATEALLWVVPRSVWPGKPIVYGSSRIQDDIAPSLRTIDWNFGGYAGTAISQSTMGEGYADFGVAGALAYMAMFGAVWGWVYSFLIGNAFSFSAAALYSLLYLFLPLSIRGFSSGLVHMGLWVGLVSALITIMCRSVRVRWS